MAAATKYDRRHASAARIVKKTGARREDVEYLLDVKSTGKNRRRLLAMAHAMTEVVAGVMGRLKPPTEPNELSPGRTRERQSWTIEDAGRTGRVITDYVRERARQNEKHPGTVDFPDGTSALVFRDMADMFRRECDGAFLAGECTWTHVLLEEVFEAVAEDDPAKLREELVQVMAVAGRWLETLDARRGE
jgi:hypothetical protein